MDSSGREWLISIICLTVILLASANQSFGCPPPFCEACQSYFFPSCTDDDTQDESGGETTPDDCGYCQECSDGDCVDDDAGGNSDDVCFGCQSCQSGECEPDDDECEGCLGCFGYTCDVNHANCSGECNQCMSDGSCQKFDVLCVSCKKCDETTGNCVDDGETCEGCKTCNSIGNCEDDNNAPECDSEKCDKCVDGVCVPAGLCTTGQCCDSGTCVSSCSSGKCCDDAVCVSECSGDKCCDEGACRALIGCEKCANGIVEDDDSKCEGCESCVDAVCDDDDDNCDEGETCCDKICCDPDGGGNCYLTNQELDDMYDDYETDPMTDGCSFTNIDDHRCYHAGDKCSAIQVSLYADASGAASCLTDAEGCASVVFWNCYNDWRWDVLGWVCACDDTHKDDPVEIGTHKVCGGTP